MRYCSLDIETTGLDPDLHNLLEIGVVVDDLKNPLPIDKLPRFHAYVLPPFGQEYVGSPFALSMHSEIFKRIARFISSKDKPFLPEHTFITAEQVGPHLREFFQKIGLIGEINVAGKNFATFDLPFLQKWSNIKEYVKFHRRVLDPSILYFDPSTDIHLPDTKECIARMNKKFGLAESETVAHTAIDDAIAVIKLIRNGINRI